jgi:hypothetical protein
VAHPQGVDGSVRASSGETLESMATPFYTPMRFNSFQLFYIFLEYNFF